MEESLGENGAHVQTGENEVPAKVLHQIKLGESC